MSVGQARYRATAGRLAKGVLRSGWPGNRVLKSALAAGLAWSVAESLGDAAPMFAVFGALNGVQPTVAASLRFTVGALVGIVLGTALAVISESVIGAPRAVVVAVLVALGLLITLRLHAYSLLGTEVVVTGLLVFALSQGSVVWALGRLAETALGGGIAIAVNALILPPDYRQDARRAIETLASELALHLRTALADMAHLPSPEDAQAHLAAANSAMRQAEELVVQTARAEESLRFSPLLRYSPLRRASPAEVGRYTNGVGVLAASLVHTQTACRAAWHASQALAHHSVPPGDWDALTSGIEQAVAIFARYILEGTSSACDQADGALRQALTTHAEVVSAIRAAAEPWDMDRATVLAETEHILDDLHRTLRENLRELS